MYKLVIFLLVIEYIFLSGFKLVSMGYVFTLYRLVLFSQGCGIGELKIVFSTNVIKRFTTII